MSLTLYDIIDGALELFERSGTHTRRAIARNAKGEKTTPTSGYAVQWDAIGAALNIAGVDRIIGPVASVTYLLQKAAEEAGYISTISCNDLRGKEGAVLMFRRARHFLDTQGAPTRAQLEGSTST